MNSHTHSLNSHTHTISHTHTRGTMDITGKDAISWFGVHNGAINNAGRQEGCFQDIDGNNPKYTNETTINKWGNDATGGGEIVDVGITFRASNGWTGDTSEPSNSSSGAATGDTGAATSTGTFTGSVGTTSSNDINSTENRPVNYTIRVWKRTA